MGQTITVTQAPSSNKDTAVLTLNRSLTGMEILTFNADDDLIDNDHAAIEAIKKILEVGAFSVSLYSNVVTITAKDPSKLADVTKQATDILENLFIYYNENTN